jgi:hypothetical protein
VLILAFFTWKALPCQGLAVCPALSCLPHQWQWIANAFSLKYVELPVRFTASLTTTDFTDCAVYSFAR